VVVRDGRFMPLLTYAQSFWACQTYSGSSSFLLNVGALTSVFMASNPTRLSTYSTPHIH